MGSPDLGLAHKYSAFLTAVTARDYSPSGGHEPPSSAMMRYYGRTDWISSPLLIYGSAVKVVKAPDFRQNDTERSYPAIYTGPAHDSNSHLHCSVWADRYIDNDVGNINVDERVVIARSLRTHPSHQPYNQEGPAPVITINTELWYDPRRTMHPSQQATEHTTTTGGAQDVELPSMGGSVWLSHSPAPTTFFNVGYCSGLARAGDVAGWMITLSGGAEVQIRIDEYVGGYEHRVDRDEVHAGLMQLVKHSRCTGIFEQLRCGPWSAVKFSGSDGPQPIFRRGAVNGVVDKTGKPLDGVNEAMASVARGVELARAALTDGKRFMSEHPAGQGAGSLQPSPGLEDHTTMHQTSLFLALIAQFNLRFVYFDQGADGHEKRKTTELVCDPTLASYMAEEVGTLRVPPGWVSSTPPLRGKDEAGVYRTKGAEAYPSPICKRFANGWIHSLDCLDARCWRWGGGRHHYSEFAAY